MIESALTADSSSTYDVGSCFIRHRRRVDDESPEGKGRTAYWKRLASSQLVRRSNACRPDLKSQQRPMNIAGGGGDFALSDLMPLQSAGNETHTMTLKIDQRRLV